MDKEQAAIETSLNPKLNPGEAKDTHSEAAKQSNCGRVDADLEQHVNKFLTSVKDSLAVAPMNLNSPEDARKALAAVCELHQRVKAHRQTARALRTLLAVEAPR